MRVISIMHELFSSALELQDACMCVACQDTHEELKTLSMVWNESDGREVSAFWFTIIVPCMSTRR